MPRTLVLQRRMLRHAALLPHRTALVEAALWRWIDRPTHVARDLDRLSPVTRIWDAKAGKEAGVLADVAPIGPGPGKNTMVLSKGQQREIVLHAQADKNLGRGLHSLGDESIRPISTQGKWLLFIRKDKDGAESARIAEIAMPNK